MLKTQQRFKSERRNVFTEVINKIAWSSNGDMRMQSIDLTETYAYRTNKYMIYVEETIKRYNIIQRRTTKEDIKEHNPNWPERPDHPYRILIVWGSRSGKTNAVLNLINHEAKIDKIYLYAKDP